VLTLLRANVEKESAYIPFGRMCRGWGKGTSRKERNGADSGGGGPGRNEIID